MHKISEDLFQNAIDLNETIVFEYHIKEDVISFSENISKYIPLPLRIPGFLEKMNIRGKIHQDDITKAIAFFNIRAREVDEKVQVDYIRFINYQGEYLWYQIKGRLMLDDYDEPDLLYGTLTYIDEETKKKDELNQTTRDRLTQLLNGDAVIKAVEEYLPTIPKEVIPNLMIVDIDDFYSLVKIYGDVVGDGVLTEVAKILRKAFRGTDIIGRVDNDRFVIFMKGVRAPNVLLERASYICQTVKEVWSDYKEGCALSVSVGIASIYANEADFQKLYGKALLALCDAKESGKDTYILYTNDMERMDNSINPLLSTREMELVKNILSPMCAWAYAVDENYQLLYRNDLLQDRLQNDSKGFCYQQNKGYSEPCKDCPIKKMQENEASADYEVYSPSLRTDLQMRTTKITMRNGKNIYLFASIKEDVDAQITAVNESTERFQKAIYEIQNIIWDVNLTKNICVRMREQDVMTLVDRRIENYETLRTHYKKSIVFPEDLEEFNQVTDPIYLKEALKCGKRIICKEVRLCTNSETYEWHSIYTVLEKINANDDQRVFIICMNINESKRRYLEMIATNIKYELMKSQSTFQKEIAMNNERYENINEMTGVLVFEYNKPENHYYLCSMFDEVFKVDQSMLVDEWSLLNGLKCHPDDEEKYEDFKERIRTELKTQKITVRLYNKYGTAVWYSIILQMLRGLNNETIRFLGTLQNVNAEMEAKVEMEYRADYDSVTGLYNSEAFYQRASEMIHMHNNATFAILSIDIDRFRIINDRFGIDVGNKILQQLGRAIKEVTPKHSLAKRYQADHFSVIMMYQSDQEIIDYMTRLSDRAGEYFEKQWCISLSYGIYKVVDNSLPIRLMCDRARIVKKQIKGNSLSNFAVYDDKIRLQQREQAEIESEMNAALEKGEFIMYLQPKYDMMTEKICGAEALVRWQHPIRGLRVPSAFLDLFESNGFITKLDVYMWEEACKYLVKLREMGINDLPISVNISRIHIHHSDLVAMLTGLVKKYDLPPAMLELEITENLFIDDVKELFSQMEKLKEAGFVIEMDDFGSGYSSLNMLRKAPVDVLKIDRFFLDEIMATERGRIIVENSVRMAKQLQLIVVAEGVETKEQLDFLRGINCDIAQGFYFARPLPVKEYEQLIQKQRNE